MAGRDVRSLLHDGETVEREVEVGTNRLVVTSHRLLAFTPDSGGANFEHVERPNVDGARLATVGRPRLLVRGGAALLVAAPLLAVARLFDTDGLLSTPDGIAGLTGAGGLLGLVERASYLVGLVDDAVLALGVLFLVGTVVYAVRYARSRTRAVIVSVAGDEDLQIPATAPDADEAVQSLRRALDLEVGGTEYAVE
jgi:hypothetical protein